MGERGCRDFREMMTTSGSSCLRILLVLLLARVLCALTPAPAEPPVTSEGGGGGGGVLLDWLPVLTAIAEAIFASVRPFALVEEASLRSSEGAFARPEDDTGGGSSRSLMGPSAASMNGTTFATAGPRSDSSCDFLQREAMRMGSQKACASPTKLVVRCRRLLKEKRNAQIYLIATRLLRPAYLVDELHEEHIDAIGAGEHVRVRIRADMHGMGDVPPIYQPLRIACVLHGPKEETACCLLWRGQDGRLWAMQVGLMEDTVVAYKSWAPLGDCEGA